MTWGKAEKFSAISKEANWSKNLVHLKLWVAVLNILQKYFFVSWKQSYLYVKEVFCWIVFLKLDGWHSSELFGMGTTWT